MATAITPAPSTAGARAFGAVKVYGSGDTAVRALDGVTVEFPTSRYTGIMGPSGSGKSTLVHCVAGLDDLTSGQLWVGDTELGSLSDKARTLLRRRQIGFVFQAHNLIPTLTVEENITLPLALACDKPEPAWVDNVIGTVSRIGPASSRVGTRRRSRWRGGSPAGRRSSSPTSPRATSTPTPARRSWSSCAAPSTS
jgi:putative ABC transport system ATP-binding protein